MLIHVTAGSPAVFTVTTATSNVAVETIEVECDADCLMTVNQSGGGSFSEIRNIVEKPTSSPESFDINTILIDGNLGPGNVSAEAISQIDINGNLSAIVTAGPRADNSDSDISTIDVGGNIEGDIYVLHGAIGSVEAGGNFEGVGFGFMVDIHARDGIVFLSAEEISFTSIFANKAVTPTTGTISRLETRSGGFFGSHVNAHSIAPSGAVGTEGIFIEGDFGSVDSNTGMGFLSTLTHPIEIQGDMLGVISILDGGTGFGSGTQGDITIHGDVFEPAYFEFNHPTFSNGKLRTLIRIGGTFGPPSEVNPFLDVMALFDGGAVGQVIVNANNASGSMGADVYVDDNPLSPIPHYTNEDLVGAVGLVPFALHDGDCIPENGQANPSDYHVDLSFYGPVTWDIEEGLPVNIFYRENTQDPWTLDNTHWDVNNSPGTRLLQLLYVDENDPSLIPSGREWLVVPVLTGASALLCDKLLTEDPVAVDDFEFTFGS